MKIFELTHIGQFHVNHNEDFKISADIGNDKLLIAVMDGCSSGTDTHFASTLIGKLLRKIAKDQYYQEFANKQDKSLKEILKQTLESLFTELAYFNSRLDLRSDELLSTVIIAIIDKKEKTGELLAVGDGLICYNGKITEYEQDNKPDYIGYHLTENFESWFAQQKQTLSLDKIVDLSISTDGIHTFKKYDTLKYPEIKTEEIFNRFYIETDDFDNENMLKKHFIELKKKTD